MRASILTTGAAIGGLAAVTLSAFAADGAPPPNRTAGGRACFFHDMANGFAAPDDHTLYVRAGVRDVYKIDLFGPCPNVDWTLRVGIVNRGSSWVCTGDTIDVIVPNHGIGPQRCMGRVVAKLTPDEVKALPKKARP